jgi:hypothetical protein
MTKVILKRLAQKGWLSICKMNNRNIRYAVSPSGIEQIARRSFHFLARTAQDIARCREDIEGLVHDLKERRFKELYLAGQSDLDFIVEHACRREGVEYAPADAAARGGVEGPESFLLFSEKMHRADAGDRGPWRCAFLWDLLSCGKTVWRPGGDG